METALSYNEAISTLRSALKFGINPSLDPIKKMCTAMGAPQEGYRCIQVAGTNGKSSTTRMIAALLREQGFRVGTYTSPHLVKYPERIEVDGQVVDGRVFAAGIEAALAAARTAQVEATEFELLTAAALWIFSREKVDWAVLECGLGGRWDATSVVDPQVAVITGIGLDHTKILGDTYEKVAAEKAAIIKSCSTAVIADKIKAEDVFVKRAAAVGAPLVHAEPRLPGDLAELASEMPSYQKGNLATSIAAVNAALDRKLGPGAVRIAMEGFRVPGRCEVLREDPLFMIDAAHNPQSAQVLATELKRRFIVANTPEIIAQSDRVAGKEPIPTLLLGVLADKDVRGVVGAIAPLFDDIVVTASRSQRSISAKQLGRIVLEITGKQPRVVPEIPDALKLLADTRVVATGSITVAGEVKRFWC